VIQTQLVLYVQQYYLNIKFPFYIWQRVVYKNKGKKHTIIIICRQSSVGQDYTHNRSSVSNMTAATQFTLYLYYEQVDEKNHDHSPSDTPRVELEMRRQKFKVILISNEWSNNIRTQFVLAQSMMMLTSSGSNSSSMQLTDSEDLTENYPASDLCTSKL